MFSALRLGTMNTAENILGITEKDWDPNNSRMPFEERKKHPGLDLLQTTLLYSCAIDVCEKKCHLFKDLEKNVYEKKRNAGRQKDESVLKKKTDRGLDQG